MRRTKLLIALAISSAFVVSAARGAELTAASPVGRNVDDFTLGDIHGKPHSLANYKNQKIVVLAFLGTECPMAKLYGDRLAELQQKYADKSVQFLGIVANRQDAITEIAAYARIHHIGFPML